MTRILVGFTLSAALVFAADTVRVWKASDLKAFDQSLSKKMTADKIGTEAFGKIGTHTTAQISHREGDGIAELHETKDDLFVVETGEATLEVGGTVASPKKTEEHEIRGPSINGAEKKKLAAGDIVYIPAGTPHRLFVDKSKPFTYFVIKVAK